jgi:hypothetical protein
MKRPKILAKIFGLFKKAEVEEDLSKDIRELEELIEITLEQKPEPKKEEQPKDKIQSLADELLGQMKRV